MIKSILIDDEFKLREVLKMKLAKNSPQIQCVAEASNVNEGLEAIQKHQPDLVFLDIAMPDGTGFDLLEKISNVNFEVIFVTGYNDFALNALRVSAVDYILKPINTDDLTSAVMRASERITNNKKIEKYELLKHNIQNLGLQNSMVVLPGCNEYECTKVEEILYCEGWQKYTKVHLQNDQVIVSSYNIGVFEELLLEFGFFRTHKSYLVNLHHVTSVKNKSDVILSSGAEVPVSRRKVIAFQNKLSEL